MSRWPLLCLLLLLALFASLLLAADKPIRGDRRGDPLPEHALARLGTLRFRHGTQIQGLTYSPDGKVLVSISNNPRLILWEPHSGRKIRSLERPQGFVRSMAISPDSKLLISAHFEERKEKLFLWNLATGELLFQLAETEESPFVLAFAPDGNTVFSAYATEGVCHWNTHTGLLRRAWLFKKPIERVFASAFAPDGKTLVIAGYTQSDGFRLKIRDWDVNTGKELHAVGETTEVASALAFSPQGTVLAVARRGGICFLRGSNLVETNRICGKLPCVNSVCYFPDGKKLLNSSIWEPIRLWDVQSGEQLREFPKETIRVDAIAVSPDGKTVATAGGKNVRCGIIKLWDARTGARQTLWEGHDGMVDQVGFLADGETVVSTTILTWNVGQVIVWPQGTGREARPVQLPPDAVTCRLCPDRSTLAVTSNEGFLLLLDIVSGREVSRCPIPMCNSQVVAVSTDNKRAVLIVDYANMAASSGYDISFTKAQVEVWDLPGKKMMYQCEPAASGSPAIVSSRCWVFSPDGQMLASGTDNHVRVWDLNKKKEVWWHEVPGDDVHRLAFSPDGRMLATGSKDGTLRLWEMATGKERLLMEGHQGPIQSLDFSPDGTMLASGGVDTMVRLWNVRDGKELQVFAGHLGAVGSVALSPNGRRLVSGSSDTTALVWDIPMECRNRQPALVHLRRATRDRLWGRLADFDAAAAYACLQELAAAQAEAVMLCRERLFETPSTPPKQIERWIAQLDDEDYTLREQASFHLERVEGEAEKALERALKGDCSLEARGRLEDLLESVKGKQPLVRQRRAVELLEQIGTPEAVDVLRQLEKKTGDAAVREDVRRSLDRLQAKQKAR